MKDFSIPFNKPDIREEELKEVAEVIRSGWLIHGKYSESFENEFLKLTGAKFAVLVSSCTAALHLSLMAMDIGPGDEIIVPAQTHTATAHAVELLGANPVFVDVERKTANILPEAIEEAITSRTKGIIIVHMSGLPCEIKKIQAIAQKHNLFIVEDCAHGMGTYFEGTHVGNFGIAGCFSFYPTKHITTGEGGILLTSLEEVYHQVKTRRAFGIDTPPELRKKPGKYDVVRLGNNYRMTDFQAALGLGQLKRFLSFNLPNRHRIAKRYIELLSQMQEEIDFLDFNKDCSYFFFPIYLKTKDRDEVILHLKTKNIGTSVHYATPVPLMSYYKNKYNYQEGMFPNAEYISRKQISLPMHPTLTENEIEYIVDSLKEKIYE